MPRRLVPTIAALALAAALGSTGCADDVSPAARVGDETIGHDELMDEVALWSESPALVGALTQSAPASSANHDMDLVTVVLTNRILFDTFGQEFDRRDLELDPQLLDEIRVGLFPQDPELSAQVMDELDPDFAERLVEDIAKQVTLQDDLGDQAGDFADEALGDVEVSSRYGRWDATTGSVVGPEGPRAPVSDSLAP